MKICVTLLSELRTLIIELGEDEPIESLSSILNTELKTNNVEFNFIFNNVICETSKTAGELNFVEDCKVYAVKKNERPLKRELENQSLNDILNHGSSIKKLCTNVDSKYCEYLTWKSKSLDEIQNQMSEIVNGNPEVLESLILQPQVENLIQNPSIISSLFSANPVINDSINNSPNKVKFLNDTSQYAWIQDIMGNSKDLEGIINNYPDHLKYVVDSKRYRRMLELFEKTTEKTESEEIEGQIDGKLLEPLTKLPHASKLIDMMIENRNISQLVVKNCPYGSYLSAEAVSSIQQVMPDAMNQLKKALDLSKEPEDVIEYMRSNPIEIDEETANNIERITSQFSDSQHSAHDGVNHGSAAELIGAISDRIKSDSAEDRHNERSDKFENQRELLNEMGFLDNDSNGEVLVNEYGNLDRAVNKLMSPA